jgi:hypothetical protein
LSYILEDFKGEAFRDKNSLAKLAANVAGIRIVHCLIIELFLAQTEVDVGLRYSQHF